MNTSVKVQSRYTCGGVFNTHRNIDGWCAVAVLDFALNEHAYVKAEYDYTRTNWFSLAPYGFTNTDYRMVSNRVIGDSGIRL